MKKIYVIIGGPGFGKTTLVKALHADGYHCEYDEKSRELIKEMTKRGISDTSGVAFNRAILMERVRQYENAPDGISFFDRGVPDGIAYMEKVPEDFWDAARKCRYSQPVFVVQPWKEIFKTEAGRAEAAFGEAVRLHERIVSVYKKLGYRLVDVPKMPIKERARFVLNELNSGS